MLRSFTEADQVFVSKRARVANSLYSRTQSSRSCPGTNHNNFLLQQQLQVSTAPASSRISENFPGMGRSEHRLWRKLSLRSRAPHFQGPHPGRLLEMWAISQCSGDHKVPGFLGDREEDRGPGLYTLTPTHPVPLLSHPSPPISPCLTAALAPHQPHLSCSSLSNSSSPAPPILPALTLLLFPLPTLSFTSPSLFPSYLCSFCSASVCCLRSRCHRLSSLCMASTSSWM